jgi:probable biosynthetic protein (TIGR04098 family)
MTANWNDFEFKVAMPHMAPGGKLSEVELFKTLGSYQWEAIGNLLGQPSQEIVADNGERLYSSFIDIELCFGDSFAPESFGEGARVHVRNRVNVFAQRFMEGLFVFSDSPIPDERLEKIESLEDLRSQELPWAYMTNAFVARLGGNTKLKVYKPAGIESISVSELSASPAGIVDQREAQTKGAIEGFGEARRIPLVPRDHEPIRYRVQHESDLNGAGLLYFARYPAIMNYAERIFLSERLDPPISTAFNACLSCDHRRIYYFANAAENEEVEISLSAELLVPGRRPLKVLASGHRKLLELEFRVDLYRGSDKTLMASSLVRKTLNAPGDANQVQMEVERILARFAPGA